MKSPTIQNPMVDRTTFRCLNMHRRYWVYAAYTEGIDYDGMRNPQFYLDHATRQTPRQALANADDMQRLSPSSFLTVAVFDATGTWVGDYKCLYDTVTEAAMDIAERRQRQH